MSRRVAIATAHGKFVDSHFGRARQFAVVDVDTNGYRFVEYRQVEPACVDFDHTEERFDTVLNAISDCQCVFVSRIGPGASQYLERKGFQVFESPDPIEDVLKKLVYESQGS